MKNNRYMLPLLSLLFCLAACAEVEVVEPEVKWPVAGQLSCGQQTRLGVKDNDLFWQYGDAVAFRAKGASEVSAQTTLALNTVDSGLPEAKFRGSVAMTEEPVDCWFAYPETAMIDEDGSVVYDYSVQDGTHKPFLYGGAKYAASADIYCELHHVGALIRLVAPEGVTSVIVSSSSDEKFSKVKVAQDGTVTAAEDALSQIEVPVQSGVTYIFMPAMSLEKGFSLVCRKSQGTEDASDDKYILKSYSSDGGQSSGYDFKGGDVLDVNLADDVNLAEFSASCTVEYAHDYGYEKPEHTYKSLLGTTVKVTGFTFKNAPSKIFDGWRVEIYNSAGKLMRVAEGTGLYEETADAEGKVKMTDEDGGWPLLIPGETYKVFASCIINGAEITFPVSAFNDVPHLDNIIVTPIGKTSWSYKDNGKVANTKDNDAIFEIGASVNIAAEIFNGNYDFKLQCTVPATAETSALDSGVMDMTSNSFKSSTAKWDGLEWKSYDIYAKMTFAGREYPSASSTKVYVTGLPYYHNFKTADDYDLGIMTGDTEWHSLNGYRLYYSYTRVTTKRAVYYSRKFAVPESVSVAYSTVFCSVESSSEDHSARCYSGITTSTNSPSTSSYVDTEPDVGGGNFIANLAATTMYTASGTGTLTSSSHVSASTGNETKSTWVMYGVYLVSMDIKYQY